MNRIGSQVAITFAGLLACSSLVAKPPVSKPKSGLSGLDSAPVQIQSDSLKVLHKKHSAVFSGNVRATKGKLRITCQKLVVDYGASGQAPGGGKILSMLFSGDVSISQGQRTGHCEQARYDKIQSKLVCTGNPWVMDGKSKIRGDSIVYLLDKDEVRVSRPKAVLDISDTKQDQQ